MSLTNIDRHWAALLAAQSPATQGAISKAFHAMTRELVAAGMACNMTDAAESMVAAIYRYTVESHDAALRDASAREAEMLADILS